MSERVSKLQVLNGAGQVNNSILKGFEDFVDEHLIELPEDRNYLDMIELEMSKPDETRLGPLTPLERNMFALAKLIDQSIQDALVEYEASAVEGVAKHIREHRVNTMTAMQQRVPDLPPDLRADINRRVMTHTALVSHFDWSVRSRFNEFMRPTIVRKGFEVYVYG